MPRGSTFWLLYILTLAKYFPLCGCSLSRLKFIFNFFFLRFSQESTILDQQEERVFEDMESGGFHSYRQLPNASPGLNLTEINARLPEINHQTNNIINLTASDQDNECTVREQDRFMPIANVIRIMRKILPPHAKISDDAKETIQECVSEYISFITGEANERCQHEQRKTITAEDVLWAMSKLGFDDYIEPLTVYLHRYRDMEGERGSMRGEPLMKRPVEFRTLGVPTFAPAAFHTGYQFFGEAGGMGVYLKDAANSIAGSSQAAAAAAATANGETYEQHK